MNSSKLKCWHSAKRSLKSVMCMSMFLREVLRIMCVSVELILLYRFGHSNGSKIKTLIKKSGSLTLRFALN